MISYNPAFPCPSSTHGEPYNGINIRCYLAARAMQGFLASPQLDKTASQEQIAAQSVAMANALIAELNKY